MEKKLVHIYNLDGSIHKKDAIELELGELSKNVKGRHAFKFKKKKK